MATTRKENEVVNWEAFLGSCDEVAQAGLVAKIKAAIHDKLQFEEVSVELTPDEAALVDEWEAIDED